MAHRQTFLFYCLLLAFPFSVKADENLVELVKKTKPAVVLIQTFNDNNQPIGQASGFFINNKGHIVTNHHVLEGAFRATIKTSSGVEYSVEGVIAKNPDADIVKLIVNIPDANTPFLNLSEIVPSEGQDIVVIGNPLGLESTISSGIVSAVRDIPAFGKILQITAPISPGSSGSPVLNIKGEVIGIATLVVKEGQNLNFAVPSDKIIALKETPQITLINAIPSDLNDAQQFYQNGLKELWQENYLAALTYFQKAKENNPQDSHAWFNVGYCYGKLGRWQDALESFKQAIKIKPDDTVAHYNLGIAYYNLGLYHDAVEACKQAIRIKPDDTMAHYNLGMAYHKLGRHQDAVESYKQAIRIKPDYADAHVNLGIAYRSLGRYQDAVESYRQAIKIKPDDTVAHNNLGNAYLELGRYQEAIEILKYAIKIKPDLAEAHFNLGLAYHGVNRYQEETEEYKQAIRIKTNYFEAYNMLGAAYCYLRLYDEAIDSFKQSIRIKPDYADAHFGLGFVYSSIGDKGSALEEYKILKTLDAEFANKLFNLIYK